MGSDTPIAEVLGQPMMSTAEMCEVVSRAKREIERLRALNDEMLGALEVAVEALAMCEPRTRHGAICQSKAMLYGRAAVARGRAE